MQAVAQRETLLERRKQENANMDSLWEKLSLAQKFAASSLTQFGYKLAYIRTSNVGDLAILICNDDAVTISSEGEIDTFSSVEIRS